MSFLGQIYFYILFQPLFNGLILFYWFLGDLGLATIALTILIKLLLMPGSLKAFKSQKQIQLLQPKIKELQNKFKDDKAGQSKALFDLYKEEKISPVSGCLPILLQLPIIIALYRVFLKVASAENFQDILYSFSPHNLVIKQSLFGVLNFENSYFIIFLALIASIAQFWQMKMSQVKPMPKTAKTKNNPDFGTAIQKQMMFIFPLMSFFIIWKLGALIGLYWLTSTLFSIIEQGIINKRVYGKETNQTN